MRTVQLETPSLPLLVGEEVFDDFAWCPSTVLEWRSPCDALVPCDLDDTLLLRTVFVLREPWDALPMELARLHAGPGLGLSTELGLAPYGLDDATDQFHAHRRSPGATLWLATDNLNGIFWALHDWAHFHNHGPFTDRPATELQCDASALAWLWRNRARLPLTPERWDELRAQVLANHLALRAREPATACPPPRVLESPTALRALAHNAP